MILRVVIPTKAGIQNENTGFRIKSGMTECVKFFLKQYTSILAMILVLTGWFQYLWGCFGGANQLMASLALMLVSAYLMSEGKPAAYAFYPMIFMFVTTVAALIYTSYGLLSKVFTGAVKGAEALIGNTFMGFVGLFLVIAAINLAVEG